MPARFQPREQLIQELELPRAVHELRRGRGRPRLRESRGLLRRERFLDAVEQERVLAALADFHHEVGKVRERAGIAAALT